MELNSLCNQSDVDGVCWTLSDLRGYEGVLSSFFAPDLSTSDCNSGTRMVVPLHAMVRSMRGQGRTFEAVVAAGI